MVADLGWNDRPDRHISISDLPFRTTATRRTVAQPRHLVHRARHYLRRHALSGQRVGMGIPSYPHRDRLAELDHRQNRRTALERRHRHPDNMVAMRNYLPDNHRTYNFRKPQRNGKDTVLFFRLRRRTAPRCEMTRISPGIVQCHVKTSQVHILQRLVIV